MCLLEIKPQLLQSRNIPPPLPQHLRRLLYIRESLPHPPLPLSPEWRLFSLSIILKPIPPRRGHTNLIKRIDILRIKRERKTITPSLSIHPIRNPLRHLSVRWERYASCKSPCNPCALRLAKRERDDALWCPDECDCWFVGVEYMFEEIIWSRSGFFRYDWGVE